MIIKNFIVSNFKEIWIKEYKELFISDPYVFHCLEREDKIKDYNEIDVSEYLRKTKIDLIYDSNFVDKKYFKYTTIIAKRLDHIHGKNYGLNFWKKSLSLGFVRNITAFYNAFKIFEKYFNSDLYDCNILSTNSYSIPNDFEDHRSFFQNSDLGQEQLFSMYINLFYPNRFRQISAVNPFNNEKKINWIQKVRKMKWFYSLKSIYYRLWFGTSKAKIKVGVLGSYFSKQNLKILIDNSNNKIAPLIFPYYSFNNLTPSVSSFNRDILSEFEDDFDNFDKFFFFLLKYRFPKAFLEDYTIIEKSFNNNLNYFKELKYIVSENWISNTQNSIFLALAKRNSLKHISNEHNCFFHPFAGSYINHVIDMSDLYLTLGWGSISNPKIIKSGSLFQFSIQKSNKENHKILFVAGALGAKATHFSGAYGYCEEKAIENVKFNISFFNNLSKSSLKEITYRGYPKKKISHIQLFDKEFYYQNILKYFKTDSSNDSAKKQMSESSLVIIDYISTAHLESIQMNIPTIFFWDPNSYYLNDEYKDFFKCLIEVGICQTSPQEASLFVEQIKDNPQKWWSSEKVQKAKKKFLSKNIGTSNSLIDYLINLAS